jgi:ribosomal protein S18 acetylase RimI-like enzyme
MPYREILLSAQSTTSSQSGSTSDKRARAASQYDYEQLADVYNQARVDYIVPMPMNGRRMREYVTNYDIDLDGSVVSINTEGLETGVGMLGLRGDRSWVTRLGVIPERRERHIGQFLMESMLDQALEKGCRTSQLEVIVGNEPAHRLFVKLGFEETRELLVIRRPPGTPSADPSLDVFTPLEVATADIPTYLQDRESYASWVEETPSLLNAGNLNGLEVETPEGYGWVIFQQTPFQMQHFVFNADIAPATAQVLLYHVHKTHANLDTKTENLPTDHYLWPVFESIGYFEAFRRTEMVLHF